VKGYTNLLGIYAVLFNRQDEFNSSTEKIRDKVKKFLGISYPTFLKYTKTLSELYLLAIHNARVVFFYEEHDVPHIPKKEKTLSVEPNQSINEAHKLIVETLDELSRQNVQSTAELRGTHNNVAIQKLSTITNDSDIKSISSPIVETVKGMSIQNNQSIKKDGNMEHISNPIAETVKGMTIQNNHPETTNGNMTIQNNSIQNDDYLLSDVDVGSEEFLDAYIKWSNANGKTIRNPIGFKRDYKRNKHKYNFDNYLAHLRQQKRYALQKKEQQAKFEREAQQQVEYDKKRAMLTIAYDYMNEMKVTDKATHDLLYSEAFEMAKKEYPDLYDIVQEVGDAQELHRLTRMFTLPQLLIDRGYVVVDK
jgi:hypothetical protein